MGVPHITSAVMGGSPIHEAVRPGCSPEATVHVVRGTRVLGRGEHGLGRAILCLTTAIVTSRIRSAMVSSITRVELGSSVEPGSSMSSES